MTLPFPPEYLDLSFEHQYPTNNNSMLMQVGIGELLLPTGKLVACDPLAAADTAPFNGEFPKGRFPVVLCVDVNESDQRIAFASIRFAEAMPTSWEMLTVGEQKLADLKPDHIYGYPVDSATGCFMDGEARRALLQKMSDEANYFEVLLAELEKSYRNTWSWLNMPFGTANLVAFSTGYGDGLYGSYVGRTPNGNICTLVTDFAIVDI